MIRCFLTDGVLPESMSVDQRRKFVLKSKPFLVIAGGLYRKGIDQIICRFVPDFEQSAVLQEAHGGISGGHFSGDITEKKILQSGLWWPTVLKDAHMFARECVVCQQMGQPNPKKIGCLIIQYFLLSHFRNGDWILWDQLSQRADQERDTFWLPQIIVQSGLKL